MAWGVYGADGRTLDTEDLRVGYVLLVRIWIVLEHTTFKLWVQRKEIRNATCASVCQLLETS
jgi:hypothetical protein